MWPDDRRIVVQTAQMMSATGGNGRSRVIGVLLREHFAVGGQVGQQPAVLDADFDVDVEETAAQGLAHRGGQVAPGRRRVWR